MLSFRGDAHKFYLKLKSVFQKNGDFHLLKEIKEIEEIQSFYNQLSISTLKKIEYRMIKEQNGTGIIPILVSSVPWLGFIFSKQLQKLLFGNDHPLWIWFILIYGLILISTVIIHYRERAWASVHIQIIEDILSEKQEN